MKKLTILLISILILLSWINTQECGEKKNKSFEEKEIRLPVSPVEISRGNIKYQEIALTFDAGAGSAFAPKILEILNKYKVPVTVFLTGNWAEKNPKLVRQIVAQGHELGNHSYSHSRFTELTEEQIKEELAKTERIIKKLTGQNLKPFFRPPYGKRDARVREIVAKEGYFTIYWTLDSTDWRPNVTAKAVRDRVLNRASSGAILLFHLNSQVTAESLEEIIIGLREKGFSLVTLSELFLECPNRANFD